MRYLTKQHLNSLLKSNQTFLTVFVSAIPQIPESSLLDYLNDSSFSKKLIDQIFVCNLVDQQIYEQFQVFNFPQTVVVSRGKPIFSFIGYNREKSKQALQVLAEQSGYGKFSKKLNTAKSNCPNGHKLDFINQINAQKYSNGCFRCDECQMLSHIEVDKPILSCEGCSYQICYQCSHENVLI